MAMKPTAGAIMKKPTSSSSSQITGLPSLKATSKPPTAKPSQKSPNSVSVPRTPKTFRPAVSVTKPTRGGAMRPYSQRISNYSVDMEDDYDYDDDFIDNTEDSNSAVLNIQDYLKTTLGFYKGPTSIQTYRKLDPHYNPNEVDGLEDLGDDIVEVNSFSQLMAMESETTKRAIEEDKREREEEKRQLREEANKRKKDFIDTIYKYL
jgi:hypothetical protein